MNYDRPLITRRGTTVTIPFVFAQGSDQDIDALVKDLADAGWADQAEALASMHYLGEDSRPVG